MEVSSHQVVIPRNILRYFHTLAIMIFDIEGVDVSTDESSREVKIDVVPRYKGIDQVMMAWIIRFYQIHYDNERAPDNPIAYKLDTTRFRLRDLIMMIEFLDFYDSPILRDRLIPVIRDHTPRKMVEYPASNITEKVLAKEVNRRKNVVSVLKEAIPNLDLLNQLTGYMGPSIGPLLGKGRIPTIITSDGLFMGDSSGKLSRVPIENALSVVSTPNPVTDNPDMFIITTDGLFARGENRNDRLGLSTGDSTHDSFTRVPIDNVISVAMGDAHSMILTHDGLYGCGSNKMGELGLGYYSSDRVSTPEKIPIDNVLAVTCSKYSSIVLTDKGVFICGADGLGGPSRPKQSFRRCPIENVISMVQSRDRAMFLTKGGLYVYGRNRHGELGLDRSQYARLHEPKRLPFNDVIEVSFGDYHSVILTKSGLYMCGEGRACDPITDEEDEDECSHNPVSRRLDIDDAISVACYGSKTYVLTKRGLFVYDFDNLSHTDKFTPIKAPIRVGYEEKEWWQFYTRSEEPFTLANNHSRTGLCLRCDSPALFTEPLQKRFNFCGDACYNDFFHTFYK